MHTPQVITSGVDYIFLIVPVVVVLFGWIGAVYWANAHPDVRRPGEPGRAIAGQACRRHLAGQRPRREHPGQRGRRRASGRRGRADLRR